MNVLLEECSNYWRSLTNIEGTLLALFSAILLASWGIQAFLVAGFVACLRRKGDALLSDEMAPPALVVLCLRGGDPFLQHCVSGLLKQDYPNYRVKFMVDHKADPALAILQSCLDDVEFSNYQIEFLTKPLTTCSLKCSSLIQAVEPELRSFDEELDDGRFIALLDADTIPHDTWLRELATPLQLPRIGATTGNRWYMPERPTPGALVRYLWNAAAIVQMYWYGIAWGGTLAIKLSAIREANLIQLWGQALCEDTMLRRQLGRIGRRVQFVPSLMMVNREDCTLSDLVPWISRQLLTARLYHPYWYAVVFHGLTSMGLLILGCVLVGWLLISGAWVAASIAAAAVTFYQLAVASLLPWIDSAVRYRACMQGEDSSNSLVANPLRIVVAIVLTQGVYFWALMKCIFARKISWRGIQYQIDSRWQIRMLAYRRLQGSTEDSLNSL